jgi:hypothetical protein
MIRAQTWCNSPTHVMVECRISAAGKICVIEAESVHAAITMRSQGLKALFVHLRPPSETALTALIREQLGADPPLGYSSADAVDIFHKHVAAELAAASAAPAGTWDRDLTLHEDPEASYFSLMETIADHFPTVVPPCQVWGYGRQLWDRSARVYGRRPLCVLILGPAAVGKTTIAACVAKEFGLLHINAGDLLYDEVQRRTPLGRCAKRYLDASQLVPDEVFNEMVSKRLDQLDVKEMGYLLDGYPHKQAQVEFLESNGLCPDKVRLPCTHGAWSVD